MSNRSSHFANRFQTLISAIRAAPLRVLFLAVAVAMVGLMTVADLPSASPVHAQEQAVTATRNATGESPPARPTDLQASAEPDSVSLTWTASTDQTVTHYAVLRRDRDKADAGVFEVIDSNAGSATSYTDRSVSPEGSYVYRVKAVSPTGVSQWSSYARADIPADPEALAPSGLSAKFVSGDDGVIEGVALAWDAPAADAESVTGYEILRAVGDGDLATLVADTGSAGTTYTDDTATKAGESYAYRVKALRGEETSQPSDRAVAIIPKVTAVEAEPLIAKEQNAETKVSADWGLIPSGLGAGDRFRLLFRTTATRDATSTDIADYDAFVQAAAAAGHADIQSHNAAFKVLGSTADVDARDNTATTYTADDKGVAVYWLNGDKVADDYEDFYDGSWSNADGGKDEDGVARTSPQVGTTAGTYTGSTTDGREATILGTSRALGTSNVRVGDPLGGDSNVGSAATGPFYGLSGVFVVGEDVEVPETWSLIPSGLGAGDRFRLIFLSSTARHGAATHIADYNGFVQTRAANGHADIRRSSSLFRVVGSTAAVDARDNTSTTYTADDKGVPIYWLGGNKVAGDYEEFYDGEWDDEANAKDESGNNRSTSGDADYPFTGSEHNGTEDSFQGSSRALGAPVVRVGRPNDAGSNNGPLSSSTNSAFTETRPLYGLSAVFRVTKTTVPADWSLIPSGLGAGDRFRLLFIGTTTRNASSSDIDVYNTFVQDLVAMSGHADIKAFSATFRMLGSTETVDARDNTGTTGTGVPIYWLGGAKVADDYAGFYDGDWDEEATGRRENGDSVTIGNNWKIWTGSAHDGTEAMSTINNVTTSRALGNSNLAWVMQGSPNGSDSDHGPIESDTAGRNTSRGVYGLSGVFVVSAAPITGDFDLHDDNGDPRGVWGNDDTIWVSNSPLGETEGDKIFAYDRSTGSRDGDKDFNTLNAAGNNAPARIWSDGETMFVLDSDDAKVYAYKMSDKSYDESKDITVAADNGSPRGIWGNHETIWVSDTSDDKLYAYKRVEDEYGTRDYARDFNTLRATGNTNARGIWSDGLDMFVADTTSGARKVYSYSMFDMAHRPARGFNLDDENSGPAGMWGDDGTLWVVDVVDDKLYAYGLPPTPEVSVAASPRRVAGGGLVTLTGMVTDPDAGPLTYAWSSSGDLGTFAGASAPSATWTAPDATGEDQTVTLTLTVTGVGGATRTATADVVVSAPITGGFDLHYDNSNARGIWGNADTIWVSNSPLQTDDGDKIFAYDRSTRVRDEGKDFNTLNAAGNNTPTRIWSDGETMFVLDSFDHRVYAYNMNDKARDDSKDIALAADNDNSQGIWGNGETIWVSDNYNDKLFAYKRVADEYGMRDTDRDFNTLGAAGNTNVKGIWSDGTDMFVADSLLYGRVFAYSMSDMSHRPARSFNLDDDNSEPAGVWGDDGTLWVVDVDDNKLYTYDPPSPPAVSVEAFPLHVVSGDSLTLTGTAAEPEGHTLTYAWTSNGGGTFADTTALITTWTAPDATVANQAVTLTLTVTDAEGETGTATVDVLVSPPAPIIDDDFGLHEDNAAPGGIWGNDDTIWVSNTANDKIYAYARSTGLRDEDKDFDTLIDAGNNAPTRIWSDGETMFVLDPFDEKVYAYNMDDKARDDSKDIALAAGNGSPQGLWGNDRTIWVSDDADDKLFAYKRVNDPGTPEDEYGTRDADSDFNTLMDAGNAFSRGIWSDGIDMFVADITLAAEKVFSYSMSDMAYGSARSFDLEEGNDHPAGIWSDSATLWVVDQGDDKLYAYGLPAAENQPPTSTDATLRALSLSVITLSPSFAAGTLAYTASVGNDVASTTVTATANHDGATVAILPADADAATDGHQVTLGDGDTVVEVTVTAEDGTTMQTYAVTVTRAAAGCGTLPTGRLWSACLTAGVISSGGRYGFQASAPSVGTLVPSTTFDIGTTTHTVTHLFDNAGLGGVTYVQINLAPALSQDDASSLTLNIGDDDSFSFANAVNLALSGGSGHQWTLSTALGWSEDDAIVVGITQQVNNPPEFTLESFSTAFAENSPPGSRAVSTLTTAAMDPDGDDLTYSLHGADADSFNINPSNGEVTTKAGVTYDHEEKSVYLVTLQVDDGKGGTDTMSGTISVRDVDEPPSAPAAPMVSAVTDSSDSLSVSWTAPDNAGKPDIESYDLRYRKGTTGDFTDGPQVVTGLTATISGLDADSLYQVQVRASNDEADGDWSPSGSGTTNAAAPTVSSVVVTSVPGDDDTYAIGDTIQVTVTFDQVVTVDTSGGTPRIQLRVGGGNQEHFRWADYTSGSGNEALLFAYTVQAGDFDDDGIYIAADELELNGGTIQSSGGTDAILDYPQPGNQSGHNVDGVLPTPEFAVTSDDGISVIIIFSETLSETTAPATAFTLSVVPGTAPAVNTATATGNFVTLALASALTSDQVVTVAYTKATLGNDAAAVQDAAGNDAVNFTTGAGEVPAVANAVGTGCSVTDGCYVVPADWGLIPSDLGPGDSFRLIFIGTSNTNASSSDIDDYNTFVQDLVEASGHEAIKALSATFRMLGSTEAVDARDNTATTYTDDDKGVPIYWLDGAKVADDYADFYDGDWDEEATGARENGDSVSIGNDWKIWTGSAEDGTEAMNDTNTESRALGNSGNHWVMQGSPNGSDSAHGPIESDTIGRTTSRGVYGLSGVFRVEGQSTDATLSALSLSGVTLSSGFAADMLTYTASVGNDVASTTVTATATHDGATVAIVPVDADDTADGHQVALGVGDTDIVVTVTAEDGTTMQTYTVTVTRAEKLAVTATANPSTVNGGGTAQLSSTVTGSVGNVSYSWIAEGLGTLSSTSIPNPVWTAFDAELDSIRVTLQLLVVDSSGTALATVRITVRGNQAPEVSLGTTPTHVDGGEEVSLTASATDPEGDGLTYAWTSSAGGSFDDAGALETTWTAPDAARQDQPVTLTLTVTDDGAGTRSTTQTLSLTVRANEAPAGSVSAQPETVLGGKDVQLTSSVADPENDALTYAWTSSGGGSFAPASAANTRWTAPAAATADQTVTLTLTVTDTVGETAFSTDVTVRENQPPTVVLGSLLTEVTGGGTMNLDVSIATDLEGDTLTYAWTSDGGGSFDDASALDTTWTAPDATDADQAVKLTLTVTDDGAGPRSTSVTVVVTVKAESQLAVTITADPTTVNGGGTVQLGSTVTGAVGTVNYSWSTSGFGTLSSTSIHNPVWTAFDAQVSDLRGRIDLEVRDSTGSAFANVQITVRGNQAPEVSATADPASVAGGGAVTLDGTATDPEGDTLTYAWTSDGGGSFAAAVALDTTWTAPDATDTAQTVMLTLMATDDGVGARSASDTVTVTVEALDNTAPAFTTDAAFSVEENQMAVGMVEATDEDAADTVSYAITGADQAKFDIDASSGVLTFKDAPDYENPGDADGNNVYLVTVTAAGGTGARVLTTDEAITVTVTDVDEPPSAPAAPTVSPVSGSSDSLSVSWTAPDNAGKPDIGSYDLQYRKGTTGDFTDGPQDVTVTTATIGGLDPNSAYEVQVRATNDEGDSPWSAEGSGTTNAQAQAPRVLSINQFDGTYAIDDTLSVTVVFSAAVTVSGTPRIQLRVGGEDAVHQKWADYTSGSGTQSLLFSYTVAEGDEDTDGIEVPTESLTLNGGAITAGGLEAKLTHGTYSFSAVLVDGIRPIFVSAETNEAGTRLFVTLSEPIGEVDVTFFGLSGGIGITLIGIDEAVVELDPITNFAHDTTRTIALGSGAVRDLAGNSNASSQNNPITNNVPEPNDPPVFASDASFSVDENQTAVGIVEATDGDAGDTVSYAITGGADQAKFDIDASSGVLTFKDAPDYEDPTDDGENNTYMVTVTATSGTDDRALTAEQSITVTVNDVDEPTDPTKADNLTATAHTGKIRLEWTGSDDAYEFRRKEGVGAWSAWTAAEKKGWFVLRNATTLDDYDVLAETEYTYQVRVAGDAGNLGEASATLGAPITLRLGDTEYRVDEGAGELFFTVLAETPAGFDPYDRNIRPSFTSAGVPGPLPEGPLVKTQEDYELLAESLRIEPGDFVLENGRYVASRLRSIGIVDDTLVEGDETFELRLLLAGGVSRFFKLGAGDGLAEVTIVDNDQTAAEPATHPPLTGFELVDATAHLDAGAVEDGATLTGIDPAKVYGFRANVTPGADLKSVKLELWGPGPDDRVARTENGEPYALYGHSDGHEHGVALAAGSYTLTATAHSEKDGGGSELGTLSVDFTVVGEPLTARFEGLPEAGHGGAGTPFAFRLVFSEAVSTTPEALRDHALAVTNATVEAASRVDGRSDLWEVRLTPETDAMVTVSLSPLADCDAAGAVCTEDGRMLSVGAARVIPGPPPNSPAAGQPTISGTARVGQTLTADTSGIADEDGLDNVTFSYQWMADDANIQGATGSSYTLADRDEGKAIKVIVSFTDDANNEESLPSTATDAVTALPGKPQSLEGEASAQRIELAWKAPTGPAVVEYVVYRGILQNGSMNGQALSKYATIDAAGKAMTYTDDNVEEGVEYRYRVAAVNADGEGKKSNWLDITAE